MGLYSEPITVSPEEFTCLVRSRGDLPPKLIVTGNIELAFIVSAFRNVDTLCIEGSLTLNDCPEMSALPRKLLVTRSFWLRHAPKLTQGPQRLLVLGGMHVLNCPMLQSLAGYLDVGESLDVTSCASLRGLPANTQVGADIQLEDCPALESLGGLTQTIGSLLLNRCGLHEFSLHAVGENLTLRELPWLERLTPQLHVGAGTNSLPRWKQQGQRYISCRLGNLDVSKCDRLRTLADRLIIEGTVEVESCARMECLCGSLLALGDLQLRNNQSLSRIGTRVTVRGACRIEDCPDLVEFPNRISVGGVFTTSPLPKLKSLGAETRVGGTLDLSNLTSLSDLPQMLYVGQDLILRGLRSLTRLPQRLVLGGRIDVTETGLTEAPGYEERILWQGIPVSAKTAFHPETLTIEEIWKTEDLAVREIMLQRFTHERFITKASPEVLDEDVDRGGERKLLRITFPNTRTRSILQLRSRRTWIPRDSALVCLSVQCPSTGALYVMRVPPEMQTCHQAAAWIAGFDDPNEYRPEQET